MLIFPILDIRSIFVYVLTRNDPKFDMKVILLFVVELNDPFVEFIYILLFVVIFVLLDVVRLISLFVVK